MKPSDTKEHKRASVKRGEERLDNLIPEAVSEIEDRVKVDKDADVAMWVIEHQLGEATQKIVHKVDESIQALMDVILKRIDRAKG